MEPPVLDPRLDGLRAMAGDAQMIADIGADHGHLAFALLRRQAQRQVLIADISSASLEKARRLLHGTPESARATFVVADGLDALTSWQRPEVIILAGMGAGLIREILCKGRAQIQDALLCLQPNRDVELLRAWLYRQGFSLTREMLVQAAGRYYVLLGARQMPLDLPCEKSLFLGPLLMRERPALYEPYLAWRAQVLSHALAGLQNGTDPRTPDRREVIRQQLRWIKEEQQ